jgi:DNA-binding NtrC family response regulator
MILLLSSESIVRTVMKEALERAGYVVFATGSLGVAVDTLADSRVELLITHPYVETISGYEAAKYLRGKNPKMAVLVVAGLLDDDRLRHRAKIEAIDIFPAPFSADQLIAEVAQVLKTAQQRTQRHPAR